MAKHERGAFVAAETFQRPRHLLSHFDAEQEPVGLGCFRLRSQLRLAGVAPEAAVMTASCPEEIERAVDGDAVDPRPEVRPLLEGLDLAVSAKKRLLHHVVGIM